jgi:5'-nucleotidase
VTISGTVGAALEGGAWGIPSLAVSLETDPSLHVHYTDQVDFTAAIHFTHFFAERLLTTTPIPDVDALKIEIPEKATPQTRWKISRVERAVYYGVAKPERARFEDEGSLGYQRVYDRKTASSDDSDAAQLFDGFVSVTPLSLDLTSRVGFDFLQRILEGRKE